MLQNHRVKLWLSTAMTVVEHQGCLNWTELNVERLWSLFNFLVGCNDQAMQRLYAIDFFPFIFLLNIHRIML